MRIGMPVSSAVPGRQQTHHAGFVAPCRHASDVRIGVPAPSRRRIGSRCIIVPPACRAVMCTDRPVSDIGASTQHGPTDRPESTPGFPACAPASGRLHVITHDRFDRAAII
jgi:hypothetical protein